MMAWVHRSCRIRRIVLAARATVFALAVTEAGEAVAQKSVQAGPNAMQGFSQNRDQPIQIEAASLEMREKSATPGPGGSSSIRRLEAKGGVVVTQKDQVVSGETAVFDTKTNLITMVGGVVLTQCKSVMRGDRLRVDMTTGVSRIESDSGTVQVLLVQGENCA
jgi:lipopolysaccharide export system protein LptA